ncbi:MAG: ABC transporter permease subunit [Caldicoprobacterales bacterium]|jgi:putative aldouronate transport system permease protein|nr:ABC transporter permease subunit [Bacillota bacterium]NLH59309.1 sugar ABC transporter permease [Clostridiales bacterium]
MRTATSKSVGTLKIKPKRRSLGREIIRQRSLVLMSLPIFIYVFIFNYVPLFGLTMAFQKFKPAKTFFEQEWVGLENFKKLFTNEHFIRVLRNTVCMSLINIILSFICAIGLAILINEIKHKTYKKVVQSVSYLPHFLSWIIVTGLVHNFLTSEGGLLNDILMSLGIIKENVHWLAEPKYFWGIVAGAHIWKETGWNSIIYLAAISGINPELYEAAYMDGANRFQRIRYITLPGIKSTFVVLLILNLGWILNAGFEVQYLLGNGIVQDVSETIDIFVLKYGIRQMNYSFATAAGMFKSVVSIIMLTGANFLAGKLGEDKLI